MLSCTHLALVALAVASVTATDTTGDPTNLANWPPCAQACIPLGLTGTAACGSLSNVSCICQNPAFALSIAGCESNSCNSTEFSQISQLSTALCAPVGGEAPVVTAAIASYVATETVKPAIASRPIQNATAVSAASSALATTTTSPYLGDPANLSSYPQCAQLCGKEVAAIQTDCDTNDVTCVCGASFRSRTAACEKVTCSTNDFEKNLILSEQLCGSLYSASPSLGSAVSSAIASATSVAAAAVQSKDVTSVQSYPACAQACINTYIPLSGCGSFSNAKCVCQTSNFNANVGPCEIAGCSPSDIQVIAALAYAFCNAVGGIGNATINGTSLTSGGNNTFAKASATGSGSLPAPITFTGAASRTLHHELGWLAAALLGMLGRVVFL